ncbi:MAG: hypothetical protein ACRD10_07815 [Terriglobia bacterium]
MSEESTNPERGTAESIERPVPGVAFPTEPLICPNCGQLLAPSCRVCVSCHQTIDFSKVHAETVIPFPAAAKAPLPQISANNQFSWRIFVIFLGIYLTLAMVAERTLNPTSNEFVLAVGGLQLLTSACVFLDARLRRIPHALRWALGSLLLWIVVFPWYLSRRRVPESPCPLMEAEASVFIRALLWLIVVLFLFGIAATLLHKGR